MDARISHYHDINSIVFKTKDRHMKLEVSIQELDKSNEPDWEAMGVKPKRTKAAYKYRRCLLDTMDIEYLKEYDDKHSILKCVWMEESVVIMGDYDTVAIKINDLENAEYEDEEEV